ncbi:sensor histidine kinase [Pseudokineococcus lusitanus]|uniref:histidine kinase n=1 Tax=Pseudokineococcus lusitanus TaxID=763993 RepID=A0A3N1GX19_9ACTN|nr:ATP-binding protein [Pseudokineococcus lusitanus]ROP34777.1 two-component system sensor histidine kinase BaeS [Pseudokineococcus lusitanus]
MVLASVASRLIALSVGVAVLSVGATTWVISGRVEASTRAEAAQTLADDSGIYQALVDYGGRNASWEDVGPTVRSLAEHYDRRIALREVGGPLVVDSAVLLGGPAEPLRARPDATLDPLSPALGVLAGDTFDPGGVDGLEVPAAPAADLEANAGRVTTATACLDGLEVGYELVDLPDGVRDVEVDWPAGSTTEEDDATWACLEPVYELLPSQVEEQRRQDATVVACLARAGVGATAEPDGGGVVLDPPSEDGDEALERCYDQDLRSRTAPPVQLFLGSETTDGALLRTLLTGQTASAAVALLAVAGLTAGLTARVVTAPLRRLSAAARRIGAGDLGTRLRTGGRGEAAEVGAAFDAMAEALASAEGARRQLVSDVAHELRNPLGTISGSLEAIRDGVYEPTPEVLDSLTEEADHLRHLVDDLQLLATADRGALHVERHPLDLAALARSVAEVHLPAAAAAGVRLEVAAPPTLAGHGDGARLRQVLTNLLGNALRHTPSGGAVRLVVAAAGDRARLAVEDTGEGLDDADLERVFERFWRGDPARTRDGGGSGLGLAITRALVHAHGGEVSAAATPGGGATFLVDLPRQG